MATTSCVSTLLDAAVPSIRLISLLPNSHRIDGDIALTSVLLPLKSAAQKYSAISYTWGSSPPLRRIWIDRRPLLLREGIWTFLNHCLDTENEFQLPQYIWVDAICINQDSVHEKNAQVAIMGDIFQYAQEVLIWLDGVSSSNALSRTLHGRDFESRQKVSTTTLSVDQTDQYKAAVEAAILSHHDMLQDLVHIVAHKYWRRMWIVQEICGENRQPRLIVANMKLDLEILIDLIDGVLKLLEGFISPYINDLPAYVKFTSFGDVLSLFYIFPRFITPVVSQNSKLGQLLVVHAYRQCMDPRDRVYSLLSLCDHRPRITVDYSRSARDLANMVDTLVFLPDLHEGYTHCDQTVNAIRARWRRALFRALDLLPANQIIENVDFCQLFAP